MHAMIKKQMTSVGVPSWTDWLYYARNASKHTAGECVRSTNSLHIRVFIQCSDAGSDEAKARRLIAEECHKVGVGRSDSGHTFYATIFIDTNCFLHQAHLVFKQSLAIIDKFLLRPSVARKWKFFSSLAKALHCWRDRARLAFLVGSLLNGPEWALRHAKAVPQKCISGRWGSVARGEARMDAGGQAEMSRMLLKTIRMKSSRNPAVASADEATKATAALDDIRLEDSAAYSEKLGRWRRETEEALTDDLWWGILKIAKRSHSTLDHFLAWLQKPVDPQELDQAGGRLAQLIDGRAEQFLHEFGENLMEIDWHTEVIEPKQLHALAPELYELTLLLHLNQAGGFFRRIQHVVERCKWLSVYAYMAVHPYGC